MFKDYHYRLTNAPNGLTAAVAVTPLAVETPPPKASDCCKASITLGAAAAVLVEADWLACCCKAASILG